MLEISNSTHHIQGSLSTIFTYPIVISYVLCLPAACFNSVILGNTARYWYQVRRKCEDINGASYKTATVNVVKFALSSLVLLFESTAAVLYALKYALGNIVCIKSQCLDNSFISHIILSLIWVGEMLPLSILSMLCLFMINVLRNSEVKTNLLSFEVWKIFWLYLTVFTLCTIGSGIDLITNIGVFIMTVAQIYVCWISCRRWKLLYETLKSKCLDYTFEPTNLAFFRTQVRRLKWGFLIMAVPAIGYLVANAILIMYESLSKVTILVIYQQWCITDELHSYFNGNSVYEFIHELIGQVEKAFLLYWSLISCLSNYLLLFLIARKAYRYRRFLAKPFHIKLVDIQNGRSVYERVYY